MLGKSYAPDVIRDEVRNKGFRYVVVTQGNDAVGYLAYRFEVSDGAILISKLYLLPALHGKGIGRQMLQYIKDQAIRAGAGTIRLFVNKRNRKAIAAYERFGFTKAAAVVTNIGGGFVMDDYRMEIHLERQPQTIPS
jgi:ribosomal protein S18 acetylase RimI-like enzyme